MYTVYLYLIPFAVFETYTNCRERCPNSSWCGYDGYDGYILYNLIYNIHSKSVAPKVPLEVYLVKKKRPERVILKFRRFGWSLDFGVLKNSEWQHVEFVEFLFWFFVVNMTNLWQMFVFGTFLDANKIDRLLCGGYLSSTFACASLSFFCQVVRWDASITKTNWGRSKDQRILLQDIPVFQCTVCPVMNVEFGEITNCNYKICTSPRASHFWSVPIHFHVILVLVQLGGANDHTDLPCEMCACQQSGELRMVKFDAFVWISQYLMTWREGFDEAEYCNTWYRISFLK